MQDDRIRVEHIQKILEQLKSIENMVSQPHYDLNTEEQVKVEVLKDESVSPAKFKPHPKFNGVFLANSFTIRAMKKDVFVMAGTLEELHTPYFCNK